MLKQADCVARASTPETRGWDGLGRDGCRVPLPWTREGESFGFGSNGAHLPQPAWFADFSVEAEEGVRGSTLELYREALALRRELQSAESLEWDEALSTGEVLAFERPGGWLSVTNFGDDSVALPDGEALLSSASLEASEGRRAAAARCDDRVDAPHRLTPPRGDAPACCTQRPGRRAVCATLRALALMRCTGI